MATGEVFPILGSTATEKPNHDGPRRRRKSSALGSELRVGDTGAPGLASSEIAMKVAEGTAATTTNGQTEPTRRISKRRRARGLASRFKLAILRHTWLLPALILGVFLAAYAVHPGETNPVHRFLFLSYPEPRASPSDPQLYGKGYWDLAFVAFYTVVLSFTREFFMQEVFKPMARRAGLPRKKHARFMEQMYTALYFFFLGPAGMYVMKRTPVWYFNTRGMYEQFPHWYQEGPIKFYYLFQGAYWLQQAIVLVLGMEKPRKDFRELVAHHIVTLALIGSSYRFHFTYIGLAIYTTHDISDFFLATSKSLNYIDSVLVAPYYFIFVMVWVYMRHYLNLRIIYSLFTEFKTVGPYELDWAGGQFKCELAFWITLTLLSCLQALNIFWLFYILRVAYRFVRYDELEDERSEGEEEEEEEEGLSSSSTGSFSSSAMEQQENMMLPAGEGRNGGGGQELRRKSKRVAGKHGSALASKK